MNSASAALTASRFVLKPPSFLTFSIKASSRARFVAMPSLLHNGYTKMSCDPTARQARQSPDLQDGTEDAETKKASDPSGAKERERTPAQRPCPKPALRPSGALLRGL